MTDTFIREIETDLDKLGVRSDEVNVRNENKEISSIILQLKTTLRESKTGVCLSAPQIGQFKRIFVINFNGDLRTFINPIVTSAKGIALNREKCLSIPGKEYLRVRNNVIFVTFMTPLGKIESSKLIGQAAYVFQQALDYLEGITLADIGLEIDEAFDNATEEERDELLKVYLDSLDLKHKELSAEIEEDPELKKLNDGITFMEKVQRGEIELGESITIKKEETEEVKLEEVTE